MKSTKITIKPNQKEYNDQVWDQEREGLRLRKEYEESQADWMERFPFPKAFQNNIDGLVEFSEVLKCLLPKVKSDTERAPIMREFLAAKLKTTKDDGRVSDMLATYKSEKWDSVKFEDMRLKFMLWYDLRAEINLTERARKGGMKKAANVEKAKSERGLDGKNL